ncbi:MAG: SMC-Scp complex subunit ScpB [Planctomycetes bacterium]|nr:SMC-Scp complex subunit ScpB [Planctomycetota bacterium]
MTDEKQPVEEQPVASESTGGTEPIRVEEFAEDPAPAEQPVSEAPEELIEPEIEPGEVPVEDEPAEPEGEFETTLESVIEAVLFASDEPLSVAKLVEIAEAGSVKTVRQAVKDLNKKYRAGGFTFRIEELAGGYQMMTLSCFNPWLSKLIKVRSDNKLTPAQLETLAIVAYKQPIIRADVEAIRGVACGEIIRNLMYKGMVKIVGRAEILGRPMLYGTTKKFLDIFGLADLKDLPKVEELKNPEKG